MTAVKFDLFGVEVRSLHIQGITASSYTNGLICD